MTPCPFCGTDEIAGPIEWHETTRGRVMVFSPIDPVTIGHQLVVPERHVSDATVDPSLTGACAAIASYVADRWPSANILTSIGKPATQSVRHLHLHVVPRRVGDNLPLPWTPQQSQRRTQ